MVKILEDVTVVVHILALLLIGFGGFLAWRWPKVIFLHVFLAAWGVIVNVFPSGETLISRVSMTFPPALSVISRVCSSTRRLEKEEPGFAFGPSLG